MIFRNNFQSVIKNVTNVIKIKLKKSFIYAGLRVFNGGSTPLRSTFFAWGKNVANADKHWVLIDYTSRKFTKQKWSVIKSVIRKFVWITKKEENFWIVYGNNLENK